MAATERYGERRGSGRSPPRAPAEPPPFRAAYNLVLNKHGDRLYEGVTEALRRHLEGVAAAVAAAHGLDFLPDLHKRWQDHKTSLQMIR